MVYQQIPTVHKLNKLAVKKIFDKKGMTYEEEKALEEGLQQQLRKAGLTYFDRQQIKNIITALIKNERGEYKKLIEDLKRWNIPYTHLYKDGVESLGL